MAVAAAGTELPCAEGGQFPLDKTFDSRLNIRIIVQISEQNLDAVLLHFLKGTGTHSCRHHGVDAVFRQHGNRFHTATCTVGDIVDGSGRQIVDTDDLMILRQQLIYKV